MLVACARGDKAAARTDTAVATSAPTGVVTGASSCPATGLWARCSLIARLDAQGLAPRVDSSLADEPPLAQRGILVHLYGSELELYVFPDSAARRAAEATLDTTKYVAYDTPLPPLGDHPTLIKAANVIAILHSRNDHQRERVSDAITAGPPQPAR
jgi:hypothetical protein